MTRKPVVLISGAGGEIGHALNPRLAERGRFDVLALDVRPRPRRLAALRGGPRRRHPRSPSARPDGERVRDLRRLPPGRAALDARRVHARDRPRGERRGHAEAASLAIEEARWHGTPGQVPLPELDRRLRPARLETKRKAGRVGEDWNVPPPCTAATSSTASTSAATSRATTASSRRRPSRSGVDFRAIRFPGLISRRDVPTGGTSDFAPEMLHAAAQGQPYACFVARRTRTSRSWRCPTRSTRFSH